ncbi:MAG: CDP-glycerol glycerophosphotransferase family protein [Candidatus Cloacimonetes bacterium]|nr:CDP-glycerol glycerophosphotransferase family protein [Candidatus Cloacimonadota bacterium]
MVFSYYLLKYPYSLVWQVKQWLGRDKYYAAYCGELLDYIIMQPVLKYLPELRIISKNRQVQKELGKLGVKSCRLPAFPRGVLMCRLAGHKFPAAGMRKIGMRHGPFHFKALSDRASYMLFDKFIFTSERESELAAKVGITNGLGIGYPKLDQAFDGTLNSEYLAELRARLGFKSEKPTLLFTATWEGSGMSAIDRWYDRLGELTEAYNVLVSLHPWISEKYRETICGTSGVHYIESFDTTAFIRLADICIGDTSSILGECLALDKPLITFKVKSGGRMVDYVVEMLERVSIMIESFAEIDDAIIACGEQGKKKERQAAKAMMFSNLDGTAGEKVAQLVRQEFGLE